MSSEVSQKADFSIIRYAQCWEDADILIDALNIRPNHSCVAIGSAGDNALAMLSQGPERLIALDISPAQIACLELRVAAYKELEHGELLELIGSTPSSRRFSLYRRCRPLLSVDTRQFWDGRSNDIELGIGNIGKLENYFRFFRTRVMPLIHPFARINRLFELNDIQDRKYFYLFWSRPQFFQLCRWGCFQALSRTRSLRYDRTRSVQESVSPMDFLRLP
jgi:S-adenosylmethionine-diacylglycerol 3-amino-3-carboxypropyl transferase